ncbi:beta-galactosidase 2 [Striga asiatica]|uniref:Beta-galactosidase 2 n=1 Tax=Striga asiatica TaxID=4170 RepID=A0A5A7PZR1_STRAF|nr:beta-galactosidase 2 [Striga asiatica]
MTPVNAPVLRTEPGAKDLVANHPNEFLAPVLALTEAPRVVDFLSLIRCYQVLVLSRVSGKGPDHTGPQGLELKDFPPIPLTGKGSSSLLLSVHSFQPETLKPEEKEKNNTNLSLTNPIL